MTYREAFNILDGVELMVLNRDFDEFEDALIHAMFLLDKEAKKEERKGKRHEAD